MEEVALMHFRPFGPDVIVDTAEKAHEGQVLHTGLLNSFPHGCLLDCLAFPHSPGGHLDTDLGEREVFVPEDQ